MNTLKAILLTLLIMIIAQNSFASQVSKHGQVKCGVVGFMKWVLNPGIAKTSPVGGDFVLYSQEGTFRIPLYGQSDVETRSEVLKQAYGKKVCMLAQPIREASGKLTLTNFTDIKEVR